MKTYRGTCHCKAVSFSFESEKIKSGLRCNCSICKRKGAVMSDFTISPDKFSIDCAEGVLGLYQFDTNVAKHYFCKNCGIYPFHQTMVKPGHYRVNPGCIDDIVVDDLVVNMFDGTSL